MTDSETREMSKREERKWGDTNRSGVSGWGVSNSIDSVLRLVRRSELEELKVSIAGRYVL